MSDCLIDFLIGLLPFAILGFIYLGVELECREYEKRIEEERGR